MARLLEGKPVAEKIRQDIVKEIEAQGKKLVLASVMVGDNPGAEAYVKSQKKTAEALGVQY